MQVSVLNINDLSLNHSIELNDSVFALDLNPSLVHQVVTAYSSNARVFAKGWKGRSQVTGSTKKPWAQKGTGRARAGSKKSPIWRGGGVTFAYKARNYSKKVNKKVYKKAIICILSDLIRDDRLLVIESFKLESCKTKNLVAILERLSLDDVLIVTADLDENLYLASRNLYHVGVTQSVDPVSLIGYSKILFERKAIETLENLLK